jgi:esterase
MKHLHYERVKGPGEPPGRWLYFLHGIFGAGRNWGSIARRVVRERPDWGALLLDLRQHGASQGFPAPHTVAAAAADLAQLGPGAPPPDALLGHSFGGKVALVAAGLEPLRERLRQLWVIDSTPETREPAGSAWEMLRLLQRLPDTFADRRDLIQELTGSGVSQPIAQWMATNLRHAPGGYRWRFERAAMEDLLRSFFATDAWPLIEAPPPALTIHVVRATESSILAADAIGRIRLAAARGQVHLHDVAGGHWLNADNPDSIVDLLVQHLPGSALD